MKWLTEEFFGSKCQTNIGEKETKMSRRSKEIKATEGSFSVYINVK